MSDVRFNKVLISVNALLPLGLMAYDSYRGALGANPLEYFLRATGVLALVILLVTLAITPVRKMTGWNSLIKYRRMLGLYAFFYAAVHLVTYGVFDKSVDIAAIVSDVWQRPFIAVGMIAFVALVPLAVTSTKGWVKRLGGRRWSKLHRLTYLVATLGVIHFWMIVKSDIFYPVVLGLVLAVLLGYRVIARRDPPAPTAKTAD